MKTERRTKKSGEEVMLSQRAKWVGFSVFHINTMVKKNLAKSILRESSKQFLISRSTKRVLTICP